MDGLKGKHVMVTGGMGFIGVWTHVLLEHVAVLADASWAFLTV